MMKNKKLLIINILTLLAFIVVLTIGLNQSKPYSHDTSEKVEQTQSTHGRMKISLKSNNIVYKKDKQMRLFEDQGDMEDDMENETDEDEMDELEENIQNDEETQEGATDEAAQEGITEKSRENKNVEGQGGEKTGAQER